MSCFTADQIMKLVENKNDHGFIFKSTNMNKFAKASFSKKGDNKMRINENLAYLKKKIMVL